jgi:hypothetical protein
LGKTLPFLLLEVRREVANRDLFELACDFGFNWRVVRRGGGEGISREGEWIGLFGTGGTHGGRRGGE